MMKTVDGGGGGHDSQSQCEQHLELVMMVKLEAKLVP